MVGEKSKIQRRKKKKAFRYIPSNFDWGPKNYICTIRIIKKKRLRHIALIKYIIFWPGKGGDRSSRSDNRTGPVLSVVEGGKRAALAWSTAFFFIFLIALLRSNF